MFFYCTAEGSLKIVSRGITDVLIIIAFALHLNIIMATAIITNYGWLGIWYSCLNQFSFHFPKRIHLMNTSDTICNTFMNLSQGCSIIFSGRS